MIFYENVFAIFLISWSPIVVDLVIKNTHNLNNLFQSNDKYSCAILKSIFSTQDMKEEGIHILYKTVHCDTASILYLTTNTKKFYKSTYIIIQYS